MNKLRAALVGFVLGVLSATVIACGPTRSACSATTCTGCCDAAGLCQSGSLPGACGAGAIDCAACQAGATCIAGLCTGGTGGGGGAGGGGGTGGGGLGPIATIDDYCRQAPQAYCAFYVRCGFYASQSACEASYLPSFGGGRCAANERAAVKDNRAAFDAARLQRCLDALRTTASCGVSGGAPPDPDCAPLVDGRVALNGPCYIDGECEGEASCDLSASACPGRCVPRVAIGMTPGSSEKCVGDGYVALGRCEAPVPLDGGCATGLECVHGAYCDVGDVCQPLRTLGQACASANDCRLGLTCVGGVCADYAGVGQTCQTSGPAILCKAELFCLASGPGVPGTCKSPSGQGGPCGTATDRCLPGFHCTTANTCAADRNRGSPCAVTIECAASLYCNQASNTCADLKLVGAACGRGEECLDDGCTAGVCVSGRCKDPTP